jgi:protein kinase C substrate 80K-H
LTHRLALTRLRSKTSRLQSELDTLHGILEELSKGYNPNYQDMAVKAAVVGYEELTKSFDEVEGEEPQGETEVEEEIEDKELDDLERKDLEGLLMSDVDGEDDEADEENDVGLRKRDNFGRPPELMMAVYRIEEYIPDSLFEQYENLRDLALDWMIRIGLIGKGDKGHVKSTSDSPRKSLQRATG